MKVPIEGDDNSVRIARIRISQFMGIEELSFAPSQGLTVLSGRNSCGKTSVLTALRSIGGTHDASLVRHGSTTAEVVLILNDGTEITARESTIKRDLIVKHPLLGRISKGAEFVKRLTDVIALNPIAFLTGTDSERLSWFLGALPLHITSEQLAAATQYPAHIEARKFQCETQHALTVLAEVERQHFDARTDVNRGLKEKRATVTQLFGTLPASTGSVAGMDWQAKAEELEAEQAQAIATDTAALAAVKAQAQTKKVAKQQLYAHSLQLRTEQKATAIQTVQQWEATELARIKAEAAARTTIIETDARVFVEARNAEVRQAHAEIDAAAQAELATLIAEQEARHAIASEALGRAKAFAEERIRASRTSEIIAGMEAEAQALEDEATRLTTAVEGVRTLRTSLTADLPIKGVEVRDGQLFVDGIPERRINEARRVTIAIEVAKLRVGKLGLIVCDGLEDLDEKSFAEFRTQALASGLQMIVAKVSDEPELTIHGEHSEAAE